MRDELKEELGLDAARILDMRCIGLTRPEDTLKPELMFYARVNAKARDLRGDWEHDAMQGLQAERDALLHFARKYPMASSGRACLEAYAGILE